MDINIHEIIEFYSEIHDKTTIKEKVTLRMIEQEIHNMYNKLYNEDFRCEDVEVD